MTLPLISAPIIVPLQAGEKPTGVLIFINTESKRTFTSRDLAMAETIGRQAAAAIETASLFHKVNQLAQTDPLTGLFNRGHFMTLAEHEFNQAVRYQRPMTLIMLDIDHFKRINDNHGHATGDRVLKAVAQIARDCIRVSDAICRYGGEEFIILLPETDYDQALIVAERLRLRVGNHSLKSRQGPITTTVSLGVAVIRSDGNDTIEQAIECADQAMYAAKQAGRNQTIVFDATRCIELAKMMRKGVGAHG
jgi:diguanylate cyclase (GGDEF)-like protein